MSVASNLWTVYYPSGVCDDWQGVAVYCLEYLPSFQLTSQDLPCSPEVFGCSQPSRSPSEVSRAAVVTEHHPWYMLHLIVIVQ